MKVGRDLFAFSLYSTAIFLTCTAVYGGMNIPWSSYYHNTSSLRANIIRWEFCTGTGECRSDVYHDNEHGLDRCTNGIKQLFILVNVALANSCAACIMSLFLRTERLRAATGFTGILSATLYFIGFLQWYFGCGNDFNKEENSLNTITIMRDGGYVRLIKKSDVDIGFFFLVGSFFCSLVATSRVLIATDDPHMHRVHYRALQELGLARSPYSNALVRIGEMPAEDRERLVIEGELDSEYLSEHSDESDEDQYDISTEDYEFEYAYGDNEGPNDGADAANAAGTTDEKRGDHDSNDEYSFQYEDDIDAKDSDTNADAIIPTR